MILHNNSFEKDDHQPKNWYKMSSFVNGTMREVTLDMETNLRLNKIHVNTEHTLIIHHVNESDSGLYFCMGLEGQESENKYNYLIDSGNSSNYFWGVTLLIPASFSDF